MSLGFTPDKPSTSFTIALVKALDPHLAWLEARWGTAQLSLYQFVHLLFAVIRSELHVRGMPFYCPYTADDIADIDRVSIPVEDTRAVDAFAGWERRMYLIHGSTELRDRLDNPDTVHYWLCATFVEISGGAGKERHSYSEFRAYILNCTMGKGASENDVKSYTVSRTFACKSLWRMTRMEVSDQHNMIISASSPDGEVPSIIRRLDSTSFAEVCTRRLTPEQGTVLSLELVAVKGASMMVQGVKVKALLLFVATADGWLRAYDVNRDLHLQMHIAMPEAITCVYYVKSVDLLALGSSKGSVFVPKADALHRACTPGETTTYFPISHKLVHHTDTVTCMETEALGECLFTGSLDRTIVQFAVKTGVVVRRLVGHKLGVLSMCYNRFYHTLVSCGLEFCLYGWALEVNNPQPTLIEDPTNPYARSIIQVRSVARKPIAVSMDAKGTFKVWDLRTNRCVGTVLCEPEMSKSEIEVISWPWFAIAQTTATLVTAANRKCYVLEYDVDDGSRIAYQAHEAAISGINIDSSLKTLVTCGKNDLHLWALYDCESINHLREIDSGNVTQMLEFPAANALIIGTSGGALKLYSTASFSVQAIWIHQSQSNITRLAALPGGSFAAVGGTFGRVEIVTYQTSSHTLVGTAVERRGAPICGHAICAYPTENGLLVGEPGNMITVWREVSPGALAKGKVTESLRVTNFQTDANVTALCDVPGCHAFICGDSAGWVNMFATDQEHIWRLCRFQLPKVPGTATYPGVTIIRVAVVADHFLLFVGDDFGYVTVYDPTPGLGRGNIKRAAPVDSEIPRAAGVRQNVDQPVKLAHFEAHPEAAVSAMDIVATANLLVTGGTDCRVQLSSLSGVHVAYYLLAKIGTGIDDTRQGATEGRDYNDLPPPYGCGSAEGATAEEVLQSLGHLGVDGAPDDAPGHQLEAGGRTSPRVRDALELTTASLRARYRPLRRGQPVIERDPLLTFPDDNEILYHVPQYIGIEHALEPPACVTESSGQVRRALYGPSAEFKSLNLRLLKHARRRETVTLPHLSHTPEPHTPMSSSAAALERRVDLSAVPVHSSTAPAAGTPLRTRPSVAVPTASTPTPKRPQRLPMLASRTPPPRAEPQFFVPSVRGLVGSGAHQKSHAPKGF